MEQVVDWIRRVLTILTLGFAGAAIIQILRKPPKAKP